VFDFFKKAEALEPEVDSLKLREAELADQLHVIDAERSRLSEEMKNFRKRSTAIVDGKPVIVADSITARPALQKQWNDLLNADAKLWDTRNKVLKALAEIRCPTFQ
jgi:hypothetical protein